MMQRFGCSPWCCCLGKECVRFCFERKIGERVHNVFGGFKGSIPHPRLVSLAFYIRERPFLLTNTIRAPFLSLLVFLSLAKGRVEVHICIQLRFLKVL